MLNRIVLVLLILVCANRANSQPLSPVRLSSSMVSTGASATTQDFAWLAGRWEAKMDGGAGTIYVVYGEPAGGVITGVMHLVSADNKNLVVELITLVDSPRGVEMRFRHFSPELEAYESDYKQSMLLTTHAANRDVFENQVPYSKSQMSTQPRTIEFLRQPDGSYIGHSDILTGDGKKSVIQSTYRRPAT